MRTPRRFESDLPALLADLYLAGTPDYRDDLVQQTARVRQRPAWTFPERWLPVELVTSRVPTTRVPWRQIGVLALIALLLAALLAVYVGSHTPRLPAPFGPAANGLVAFAQGGDIYTVDPDTGTGNAIVGGPDTDSDPAFSPDGTRIAFLRTNAGALSTAKDLVVTRADGSDLLVITATPIPSGPSLVVWANDSRSLLVGAPDNSTIWLFDATRAAEPRTLVTGADAYLQPFRPPDGSAILIRRPSAQGHTLIRLDLDTLRETTLAEGGRDDDVGAARWSPDGSRVVYNSTPLDDPASERLFIVNADGTATRQITQGSVVAYDIDATWSPDGSRIAFTRYVNTGSGFEVRPIGIYSLADGSIVDAGPLPREARAKDPGPKDGLATQGEGYDFEWSPDGKSLVALPGEAVAHPVLIDALDGTWRNLTPLVDPASTKQSWQRLAP
jgi:dipeptidyl aminopeptidase/acylaminoacyl peptidase